MLLTLATVAGDDAMFAELNALVKIENGAITGYYNNGVLGTKPEDTSKPFALVVKYQDYL